MKLEWRDVSLGGPPVSTSLTAAETAELQRLAAGKDVLEIGSAYGYSTVALAQVAKSVTAVDPHTGHGSLGQLTANLAAYGVVERVRVVVERSQEALPKLDERYDLVWVDGDHTADVVTHDVQWALKLLKPSGVLALHDLDETTCPGIRVAVDAWRQPDYVVDTLAVYVDPNGAAGPGEASRGEAPHGWARRGVAGTARPGTSWRGQERHGTAGGRPL